MSGLRSTAAAGPHVLIFPLPLLGHAAPQLNLAEVLSHRGLHVTFLTTDHVRHRLRRCADVERRRHPGLRLRSIPDGLPADNPRSMHNMGEMYLSLSTVTRPLFRDLLRSMRAGGQEERPPVTCVIADVLMEFAAEVAEELEIPVVIFCTHSPCSFWASFCIPKLIESGELPFADRDMDETVRGVPGAESFLRRRDLPSFCRAKDANEPPLQYLAMVTRRTTRARGLIFNTMEPLDGPLLAHIRKHCSVTYTVGPLHTLVQSLLPSGDTDDAAVPPTPPSSSSSAGDRQEDLTCMAWLDSQPSRSVVYVSFGSLHAVTREQLLEVWHGLVNSGHRFLMVMRPDLIAMMRVAGETPGDVAEGTSPRGLFVGWAPQQEVLAHPAVGAFLTHSGWNSTLESICAGVPMICWPFFFDQLVNSRFVSVVWRAGVDMKDTCDRITVERMVREVMEGETGEGMRSSAATMAKLVKECMAEGGSSRTSLEKLIQDVRAMSTMAPATP